MGPAFSFKSRDTFVLKDKTVSEQPELPVGKELGSLLHSDQTAGPLALARVRVANTPGRILKWELITCSRSSMWTSYHRCPLPSENSPSDMESSEKMPERDGPTYSNGYPVTDPTLPTLPFVF